MPAGRCGSSHQAEGGRCSPSRNRPVISSRGRSARPSASRRRSRSKRRLGQSLTPIYFLCVGARRHAPALRRTRRRPPPGRFGRPDQDRRTPQSSDSRSKNRSNPATSSPAGGLGGRHLAHEGGAMPHHRGRGPAEAADDRRAGPAGMERSRRGHARRPATRSRNRGGSPASPRCAT